MMNRRRKKLKIKRTSSLKKHGIPQIRIDVASLISQNIVPLMKSLESCGWPQPTSEKNALIMSENGLKQKIKSRLVTIF